MHIPPELFQNKRESFQAAMDRRGLRFPFPPEGMDVVFAFSDFAAQSCTRHPEMLLDLIQSGDLQRVYSPDSYVRILQQGLAGAETQEMLAQRLRQIRMREMVRIAWRDLVGWADLQETLTDLSAFADACIVQALDRLYHWECRQNGTPLDPQQEAQNLVVVGMGKLGAHELNYSSDIDLLFAYPHAGRTDRGWSNEEFFSALGRRLIQVLGAKTVDGRVFRVDMRLRPYGENGPLVMNFDALEAYYQYEGRPWERYAWIKARVITGGDAAAADLMERLKPFVYRRYLDFGTFETLREMKQKITLEVTRKGLIEDIKTGPGGIREIEFFGQIFQMLRGGVRPILQRRRICEVLWILAEEELIQPQVRDELLAAYVFLRRVEHRLQEFADQQTHRLPSDAADRQRLALSMGFEEWPKFQSVIDVHRKCVHTHFQALLSPDALNGAPEADEKALLGVWQEWIDAGAAAETLAAAGYRDPGGAAARLAAVKSDLADRRLGSETRRRLDKLMPRLLRYVGDSPDPDTVLVRILQLIRAIESRACYLALLLENPDALNHLINLAYASPWIASFLSRHPALLDELLDPRTLYAAPRRAELTAALSRRMNSLTGCDLEEQMEVLRVFKQTHILRVAAADINGGIPLMRVSDYLSYIAESVLARVLDMAWHYLVQKHGTPVCRLTGCRLQRGYVLIAYGRLGGLELGYSSDLDLAFLHAGEPGSTQGGEQPIDNAAFFARLGQRTVHLLNAHTEAGILYGVNMQLRPSGRSGLLVSRIDTFHDYQLKDAWTWEHQALVRARAVSGDTEMAAYFNEIRREALTRARPREPLRASVVGLRERLRKAHGFTQKDVFELDQSVGGILDIEFLVQYLILLEARTHPEIVRWTDNVRQIQALARAAVFSDEVAYLLRGAYLRYRAVRHRLSLQEKPPRISARRFAGLRRKVRRLWNHYLGEAPPAAKAPSVF